MVGGQPASMKQQVIYEACIICQVCKIMAESTI